MLRLLHALGLCKLVWTFYQSDTDPDPSLHILRTDDSGALFVYSVGTLYKLGDDGSIRGNIRCWKFYTKNNKPRPKVRRLRWA